MKYSTQQVTGHKHANKATELRANRKSVVTTIVRQQHTMMSHVENANRACTHIGIDGKYLLLCHRLHLLEHLALLLFAWLRYIGHEYDMHMSVRFVGECERNESVTMRQSDWMYSPIPLLWSISSSFLMLSSRAFNVCLCVSLRISRSCVAMDENKIRN